MRIITLIFFALCTLLTGCKTYNQVTLEVSSPDGAPIVGATVQAAPMYFFNPTDKNFIIVGPYDILEPFTAKGDAGTTDELGQVQLEIVSESPLELNVYAETYQPWKGQIAITKQGSTKISPYPNKSVLSVTTVELTNN